MRRKSGVGSNIKFVEIVGYLHGAGIDRLEIIADQPQSFGDFMHGKNASAGMHLTRSCKREREREREREKEREKERKEGEKGRVRKEMKGG